MANDELEFIIREKFKNGERRSEIKEDLLDAGYYEDEIEDAITDIQHDALKQLPIISSFYQLLDHFEKRSNLTTTRMTIVVMAVCVGVLLLLATSLYFIFDPLGTRSTARDAARASDLAKIQTSLGYYYQQYHKYPNSLNELVPTFLEVMPHDPQSGSQYSYKVLNGNTDYQLCSAFELQPQECVNALPDSSVIPVVSTPTPIQTFVPQKSSSNPSVTGGAL
jgi:hypothetical protein